MSTESFVGAATPAHRRRRPELGLVGAELLKLRKRRGLLLSSIGLSVVPMLIGYGVVAGKHASDPDRHGPAGDLENFVGSMGLLSGLVALVAIIVGVTAGTGDLRAGVFRELVVTGRSRISLFAARIPGGLALVVPVALAGYLVAAIAAATLSGGEPAPDLRLLVLTGAWIAILATVTFLLALGASSVIGSTGTSIGLLLGWQALIAPLLLGIDELGIVRDLLPGAGLLALAPEALETKPAISMAPAASVASLVLWTLVPLAAGAWRTNTRDA